MSVNGPIEKAKSLAKKIHKDRQRTSGESYWAHCQKVYKRLLELNIEDESLLILALLHHGHEHLGEIEKSFGEEVANLVQGYHALRTRHLKNISPREKNQQYIIQAYMNLTRDYRLLLVRLADKTVDISTIGALASERRINQAERALYLHAPLCRLLGIGHFSRILENEAFKILDPRKYYRIAKVLRKKKSQAQAELNETKKFLLELLAERGFKAEIYSRVKHVYSIHRKVARYRGTTRDTGSDKNLDGIRDIFAMCILVNSVGDCYAVEDILRQLWPNFPEERDDYIQKPTPVGYQALHNTFAASKDLNLEIQVKTHEMHEESEFGLASHAVYKIGERVKKYLEDNPALLRELNVLRVPEHSQLSHFDKNVYVFTPKGEIIELPRGANLIDFAYAVHAEIGDSCTGGMIDGKMAKLTQELSDGARVKITTSKAKRTPSRDWLNSVKTRRAREAIRKSLRR